MERPGLLLVSAFIVAHMVTTFMSAMVSSVKFAGIEKIGWRWIGVIWLFNILTYFLLDPIKFVVRYALRGRAWGLLLNQKTTFTNRKDFGKEARPRSNMGC